ncbi:hypothetical protein SCD_n00438 [Sulfuricella denitrificans skB26]|uniref:HEPN AbiU2-like domain-containing protein n=1 Tax=Sulfuricella denitrificans (strain DSM 22764 / NBRC 105220 / skB26) TaxID=1163617 RepID=S6B0S9_SULDS|nr:hypothetical protein [Sulfuricella denitrificans]BAN34287.1 hypothetical protein SCD_n00438 [Sulfuricella denitrificans skB26]
MPTQIEKLEGHTSHLLDAFIRLRERYALLEPMLFDQQVPKLRGAGRQARGFLTLRHSLFLSCAQDIAKLSFDSDERTPSIKNLMAALDDSSLTSSLRERFAVWHLPSVEEETDPEIVAVLRRMKLREQDERRTQFDEILAAGRTTWNELATSGHMSGFLTIRDKITAHTEVQHVADKYQPVDIGNLGIKWADLRRAIDAMQNLVEALGLLIRNAGFAWDMLDEQLSRAGKDFWLPADAAT